MSADANPRWDRIASLFMATRALDLRARDSFLTLACDGDDALRAEVEALLAGDVPEDGFLVDPPWTGLARSLAADLASPVLLASGELLNGRYRIDSELGTGGQAFVYLARDEHLAMRPVVIKVMRAEGHRNRWLKSRFEQEMRALARIDHPGVVGILDVGELADGTPFLVIQYIPGTSLREVLAQGPIPPVRAADILRQMGSALRAAHAVGIAHRDLKPGNIMLQQRNDGSDVVRLIDFGIAKIDRSGLEPETVSVQVAGTVRYMAPEQFEGRHSAAADVYTMALVACEMLGGYPHVRALPAGTRRETRDALESALAFRPDERPADVQAWSESVALTLLPRRPMRRTVLVAIALATIALAAAAIEWRILDASAEPVRIVEKVGAFDPLTEGFEAHWDIGGSGVTENPTRTGYDAWRVVTGSRGAYLQAFTDAQKRRAMDRGWKLSAVIRAEQGAAYAAAEFKDVGPGFPINVLLDGDREVVRLPTQIVPEMRGLEFVQHPPGAYHRYELVYDPALKAAELWVDGERRLTGYRGWTQDTYGLGAGLNFGTTVYGTPNAAASFRSVRFEINP